MGSLIGKTITNVLEVPLNVLISFVGRGLVVKRESRPPKIETDIGKGLKFNNKNQVVVDNIVSENNSYFMTQCSNTSLELDGRKLTLTKTIEEYKVCRNNSNIVFDIVLVQTYEEKDEIIMTDCGYGNVSALSKPNRKSTPDKPSFYKK